MSARKTEWSRVVIDVTTVAGDDPMAVIDPVWWAGNIYDGPEAYDLSLAAFSLPQRLVFAMLWYDAEVCNGGHSQFYSNSTGIVWIDALRGFEAVGLEQFELLLRESAGQLGGSPSLIRAERENQMERLQPDFDDLDDRYFAIRGDNFDSATMAYIRARPSHFYFSGMVEKPLPLN